MTGLRQRRNSIVKPLAPSVASWRWRVLALTTAPISAAPKPAKVAPFYPGANKQGIHLIADTVPEVVADGTYASARGTKLPNEFETGGIIGIARLEDCVTSSRSRWFHGPIGWRLTKPKRLRFIRLKGRLGIFDPPEGVRRPVMEQLGRPL